MEHFSYQGSQDNKTFVVLQEVSVYECLYTINTDIQQTPHLQYPKSELIVGHVE